MHAYRQGGDLSLDQYFARGQFPINYPRYTDPSGSRIIVDRVIRYENLIDELTEIFARLNVPFEGDLGVRAKGQFRTDRTPYQSVFSLKQRQIVERIFAREIQLHSYRFDGDSSAKNYPCTSSTSQRASSRHAKSQRSIGRRHNLNEATFSRGRDARPHVGSGQAYERTSSVARACRIHESPRC